VPSHRLTKQLASRALLLATFASALCFTPTLAQTTSDAPQSPTASASSRTFTGSIIGGAISLPEYEGSSDMTVVPLIAGELRWGNNRYAAWDGIAGRINILDNERFEFGPAMNLGFYQA
jgi:hypothetical protein